MEQMRFQSASATSPNCGTSFPGGLLSSVVETKGRLAGCRGASDSNGPPRVLVVEDDASIRRLHARILTVAGFAVDSEVDGEAGWQALQHAGYNLLITDNQMPRLDGVDLIIRLRAAEIMLPAILASGAIPWADADVPDSLQPVCMLQKPFGAEELLAMVRSLLERTSGNGRGRGSVTNGRSHKLESLLASVLTTARVTPPPMQPFGTGQLPGGNGGAGRAHFAQRAAIDRWEGEGGSLATGGPPGGPPASPA